MTLALQILTVAAAAAGVVLLLVRPWRSPLAPLVAIALAGVTAVGAANAFGEVQIALAWLAALVVSLVLRLSPESTPPGSSPAKAGPFRLLGRVRSERPSGEAPDPIAWRDRVFHAALATVLAGGAGMLADRAVTMGATADVALTWAALLWFAGGLLAAVIAEGSEWRIAAFHVTLYGLAIALVLVDRDWGRALAIGVVQVIVAINGVVSAEARAT